jgi:DNA polymerase-4
MSCSYDVRAKGVRPGMFLAEAARRCPQAIFRRGDSQGANRLRMEVARVLMRTSPLVEVASIDDFLVEYTGCERLHGPAFATAERLRAEIWSETRLPVTIGIATSRTMARLAGKLAKPGGVAELLPGHEEAFLRPLPVEHLPGVGHSTQRLCERFALRTVGHLQLVSREVMFATFGPLGLTLYDRARGIDPDPVVATFEPDEHGALRLALPRSIQRVSTFEPEEGRRARVEAMLSYLVERAAARLRSHGLVARSLQVSLRYVDTRPAAARRRARASGEEGPRTHVRRALPRPTDSTDELWRHARALLAELPRRRALVKRVGLTLLELQRARGWQGSLFDLSASQASELAPGETLTDRHRRLDAALDDLRARFGFGRVLRGASAPLLTTDELERDGFRLRTPSLNQ